MALEGGEWSVARAGRTFHPRGKTRYPLYRRLGGPQGRSGRAEILAPTGFFFFKQTVFIVTLVTVEIQLHFLQGQTIHTTQRTSIIGVTSM